jgi:TorA maturation chaperone TorD
MDRPTDFISNASPTDVCRLQKTLFGLKQASRLRNIKFDSLIRSTADSCVYRRNHEDSIIVLAVWVDDGLLCGRNEKQLMDLINQLTDHLDFSAHKADFFIGTKIDRDRPYQTIYLPQHPYTMHVLQRDKMA